VDNPTDAKAKHLVSRGIASVIAGVGLLTVGTTGYIVARPLVSEGLCRFASHPDKLEVVTKQQLAEGSEADSVKLVVILRNPSTTDTAYGVSVGSSPRLLTDYSLVLPGQYVAAILPNFKTVEKSDNLRVETRSWRICYYPPHQVSVAWQFSPGPPPALLASAVGGGSMQPALALSVVDFVGVDIVGAATADLPPAPASETRLVSLGVPVAASREWRYCPAQSQVANRPRLHRQRLCISPVVFINP